VTNFVAELAVQSQPTAVIAETTTWAAFPALWPALLGEVWETVRALPELATGRNVMFYKDDVPNVEIGCEVAGSFAAIGRVAPGQLREARRGAAHGAIADWCDRRGLERAGPRWEVYGHGVENLEDQVVDVYYLLG
jgi:hypothetical protein